MDRRDILRMAGLGSAAVLAPFLALERAAAQVKLQAHDGMKADQHIELMNKVLGPGLVGKEEVAMLLYPGFTALDLVRPHYFLPACLARKFTW